MSNAGRGDAGSCTTGYLPKGTQGRFRNCPSRTHRHLCRCPEAQTHLPPDQRHDLGPARNHGYLHKRWAIELLFKQIKQNFPLKYFYGESANAIKIQIWVTLIANLLLMIMRRRLIRSWSFSGLATMVRITLMYYVDFYSLFNHPEILLSAKLQNDTISLSATPINRRCGFLFRKVSPFSQRVKVRRVGYRGYPRSSTNLFRDVRRSYSSQCST